MFKIVLSPAKSLNTALDAPCRQYSHFIFQKEAQQIDAKLKKLKPKQLMELMEISDNWQNSTGNETKNVILKT